MDTEEDAKKAIVDSNLTLELLCDCYDDQMCQEMYSIYDVDTTTGLPIVSDQNWCQWSINGYDSRKWRPNFPDDYKPDVINERIEQCKPWHDYTLKHVLPVATSLGIADMVRKKYKFGDKIVGGNIFSLTTNICGISPTANRTKWLNLETKIEAVKALPKNQCNSNTWTHWVPDEDDGSDGTCKIKGDTSYSDVCEILSQSEQKASDAGPVWVFPTNTPNI